MDDFRPARDKLRSMVVEMTEGTQEGWTIVNEDDHATWTNVCPGHISDYVPMVVKIADQTILVFLISRQFEAELADLVYNLFNHPAFEAELTFQQINHLMGSEGATLRLMAIGLVRRWWDVSVPEVSGDEPAFRSAKTLRVNFRKLVDSAQKIPTA